MTYVNSLAPDQARQNVGSDLDPNSLTLVVFLKDSFEKINFEKKSAVRKANHEILPIIQSVKKPFCTQIDQYQLSIYDVWLIKP